MLVRYIYFACDEYYVSTVQEKYGTLLSVDMYSIYCTIQYTVYVDIS